MTTSQNTQRIPVLDLQKQYEQIAEELEERVLKVVRSGNYILGQNVSQLESALARLCACEHGIGVANGTDALVLALWALDIGPGDEVITPPFTFAATAEATAIRGAKPVFVDVDPLTFNLNPRLIEAAITPRTRAIMPVHLYGQPADMHPILEIANRHGLKVIEDNAQAIGANYRGQPTGSLGDLACISFYPTKNLGAAGDAGMLVTGHAQVAERLRVLRAHGCRTRYFHDELGVNSRLDEIQAAVLITKLPHLAGWNEKRRAVAAWYGEALAGCQNLLAPTVTPGVTHVWHQYTVRIVDQRGHGPAPLRDSVKQELAARGIDSMCYYPLPLHLQPAFASLGYKPGDFPVAEALSREVLSLPMYPELTREQVLRVVKALKEILGGASIVAVPGPVPVQPLVGF